MLAYRGGAGRVALHARASIASRVGGPAGSDDCAAAAGPGRKAATLRIRAERVAQRHIGPGQGCAAADAMATVDGDWGAVEAVERGGAMLNGVSNSAPRRRAKRGRC